MGHANNRRLDADRMRFRRLVERIRASESNIIAQEDNDPIEDDQASTDHDAVADDVSDTELQDDEAADDS